MDAAEYYQGPPPCQEPDCESEAHFRSGYTHCLDHDWPESPRIAAEPPAIGTASDEFTFFYGASCGSSRKTLRQTEEPNVMLSYATASRKPWDSIETLMVDSGGYSLLYRGDGEYEDTVDEYLDYVARSGASYYITRDVPTADDILGVLDGGVSEAISRTVDLTIETLERHDARQIPAEPVAVLQGVTPEDYVSCYHELVAEDAVTGRLAIGSLKGRSVEDVVSIITTVRDALDRDTPVYGDRIELHGLGVDVPHLQYPEVRQALSSADSSRYISTARWRQNRGEHSPRLRSDEPRSGWYNVLQAYLDMRDDIREALGQDVDPEQLAAEPQLDERTVADEADSHTDPTQQSQLGSYKA